MSVDAAVTTAFEALRARVTGAIQSAASVTGASFEYLLAAAKIESNMNPTAGASTSSARGLYQFIDQTWLGTVKEAGARLGYGQYADAITRQPSGRYTVEDPAMRDAILKMRDDPAMNAAMAGALSQSNSFKLTGSLGRRPSDGELYIAHFLGVGGAAKLISAAQDTPGANAVAAFPAAAAANRPIFYDRSGAPRSVGEVYSELNRRYARAADAPAVRTALANAGVTPGTSFATLASAQAQATGAPLALAPPQQVASAQTAQNEPMFRSLFQVGAREQPVSSAVQTLWATTRVADASQSGAPLDLFSDRTGRFAT